MTFRLSLVVCSWLVCVSGAEPDSSRPMYLPQTVVVGEFLYLPSADNVFPVAPEELRLQDASELLQMVPGAAVIKNGPLTGIAQLRGLSGERAGVLVDGMSITPACPNHMDPPLHYVSPNDIGALTVHAGISPVSQGGDSIGGTIRVEAPELEFATNASGLLSGRAGGFYRGENDGVGGQFKVRAASEVFAARYAGSYEDAGNQRFPGGRVADTAYEVQRNAFETGVKSRAGVWSLDGGVTRTRDAGTPALPMDMIQDDSHRIGVRYRGDLEAGTLAGRFYFNTIKHLMDNFSLRPLGPGAMRMEAPAHSDDYGVAVDYSRALGVHTLRVGSGFVRNEFDAYQRNLMSGMRQDILNDAERTRVGTYVEWQTDWSAEWAVLFGVRNDTVLSDSSRIEAAFPMNAGDRTMFDEGDRNFTDVDFDAMAALRFSPGTHSTFELAMARKMRAPSLLERYLWTPLSASAGQADGRTYLGNLDLDPEVSYQVAATADFHGSRWQVKATPFYNYVTDYVQGRPINRMLMGSPVLQFQNLSAAELYGVDAEAKLAMSSQFTLRGSLSYVRGFNLDDDDYLYRIPPLRGFIGLDHQWKAWSSSLELELADDQCHVARYNDERQTKGYALVHFRTRYVFFSRLTLEAGVENITDEHYADHLSGINRVLRSDVPVGERIPGAGRFGYVSASVEF